MSLLLLRRKCNFDLSMLKHGMVISRKQYKSLYEKDEVRMCFTIHSQPQGKNISCRFERCYELRQKEIFGQTRLVPVPTSNNEKFYFFVEGTEPLP